MATYKEIKGTQIEVLASDPSNPVEGQVWYNSTSNVLKGSVLTTAGTWATANAMNNARFNLAGTGSTTAGLAFGGEPPGGGGSPRAFTETWNGSAWTEVGDLNVGREAIHGAGTQPAAIAAGGAPTPADTELWNGVSWTEVADMNSGRHSGTMAGATNTAALYMGGTPGGVQLTESWNGTGWTEVNDLNTGRTSLSGSGTYTSAVASGGSPSSTDTATETWNGTNWTTEGNLNTGRELAGAAGSDNSASVYFGGRDSSGPAHALTEEFTKPSFTVKTITD